MRAGDTIVYTPTGEVAVVAYADGVTVSLDSIVRDGAHEWHEVPVFFGGQQATVEGKPVTTKAPPRGITAVDPMTFKRTIVAVEWPKRQWKEFVPFEVPVGEEAPAPAEAEFEVDYEVVVHASDCQVVKAATLSEHEAMLQKHAAKGAGESAPCFGCVVKDRDKHPESQTCSVCGGSGLEKLDRRPEVCSAQLAFLNAVRAQAKLAAEKKSKQLADTKEAARLATEEKAKQLVESAQGQPALLAEVAESAQDGGQEVPQ